METNYVSRDTYGMYKDYSTIGGPGPALMGADTLLGNDVYNAADENLGTIKEFMIDMQSGRISLRSAVVRRLSWNGRSALRRSLAGPEARHRE